MCVCHTLCVSVCSAATVPDCYCCQPVVLAAANTAVGISRRANCRFRYKHMRADTPSTSQHTHTHTWEGPVLDDVVQA